MHSLRNLQRVSQRLRANEQEGVYFYNAMRLRNMVFSFALGRCKVFRGPVSGTSGAHRFLSALRRPLGASFRRVAIKIKNPFYVFRDKWQTLSPLTAITLILIRSVGYCSARISRGKISFEQHRFLASTYLPL